MAVYKKTYRPYDGPLTAAWSRFLILPRDVFEDMRRNRFLSTFFIASLLYPLGCALVLYVNQNLNFLKFLPQAPKEGFLQVNDMFFLHFLGIQSMLSFFLSAFVGPGLISPDLANNAIPLYLSRPFSRTEYVLGKMSVLLILLSVMTWIPGLLLWSLHGYLVGGGWWGNNLRIAYALFAGAWVWILLITLMALAFSAWVKWKPVAGALIFGTFFISAGVGAMINAVLRTKWGSILNMSNLIGSVWVTLFQEPKQRGAGAVFFRIAPGEEIDTWICWVALAAICGLCLYLLSRKIRGAEVVS